MITQIAIVSPSFHLRDRRRLVNFDVRQENPETHTKLGAFIILVMSGEQTLSRHRSGRSWGAAPTRDLLRAYLQTRQVEPGKSLPYENQLAKDLGCHRAALREALNLLTTDGLLSRKRSIGTSLRFSVPSPLLNETLNLAQTIANMHPEGEHFVQGPKATVHYEILTSELMEAPPLMRRMFRYPKDLMVVHVERSVLIGCLRVGHWDIIVPSLGQPDALAHWSQEVNFQSLLMSWAHTVSLPQETPLLERIQVEAGKAATSTARVLQLSPERPVLLMRRQITTKNSIFALAFGRCVSPAATFEVFLTHKLADCQSAI